MMRKAIGFICIMITGCLLGCTNRQVSHQPDHQALTGVPSVKPEGTNAAELTGTPEATANPKETGVPTSAETPSPSPTLTPTPTPSPTPTPTPVPEPTGTDGEVSFSESSHFLPGDSEITLTITEKKAGRITFTLDGSEPMQDSAVYDAPIVLKASGGSFPNCVTIAAKAWYEDGTESPTYLQTYYVSEEIESRFSTYVLSIVGKPSELTEGPKGILYGDNVKQRGRASERKVHVELISSEGETVFSQYSGIRVHGGESRTRLDIKPLKLYARKEYEEGRGSFLFDGFGTMSLDGSKRIEKYDQLILRNGGDDHQQSDLREEFVHRLAAAAGFSAYEASVPVVVYLNGSYYGYYWLHESYCDKYFKQRNGKSDGEYIVLEGNEKLKSRGTNEQEAAAAKEYNSLYAKFSKADLTDEANFAALSEVMDVWNYMDYMTFNLYISNYDWPWGNYKCFRYYANDGVYGEGEQDGRWRFLLHDADISFGCYDTAAASAGAKRQDILTVITKKESEKYAPLLNALLKREDCRNYFEARMNYYMDEAVSTERVDGILDGLLAERDGEMPYYYEYLAGLKKEGVTVWTNEKHTKACVDAIRLFTEKRPEYVRAQIDKLKEGWK